MAALLVTALAFFPFVLGNEVPAPVNLNVQALNTNYILHWSWPGMDGQTANFTVQWTPKFRIERKRRTKWRTACEETSDMFCDLTPKDLLYLGIYTLQVRATVNGHHSEWKHLDFAPSQNAAVGPPTKVLLSPADNDLEVSISEPQTSNNKSMREHIYSLQYRFLYWERHSNHKKPLHIDTQNTIVVLKDLKSSTQYCVSVQSRTKEPNRTSAFTDPVCISTQGGIHWGTFSWIFIASLLLVLLIGLGILSGCYYCKKIFKPSVAKPAFLEEPWHFPPMFLKSDCQSEECDHLTVKSSPLEQAHPSAGPEWQSSSDSQDSGIYSTSNKTSSEQSTQLWRVGQLSAQGTSFAPKITPPVPDEGFGDITV